jgi:fatty-acyl-CoA synthase
MPGGDQTLRPFLWRAERLYPDRDVVARTTDGVVRRTYADCAARIRRLSAALDAADIGESDRVATVCWNHHRHYEAYFGVPLAGAQLHTVNPLLPADDLRYVVESAGDRLLVVDRSLLDPVVEAYDPDAFDAVEGVVVAGGVPESDLPFDAVTDYESFVDVDPRSSRPDLDPDQPAGLCHTSGTTGRPKGVAYTHRDLWSHTMAIMTPMGLDIGHDEVVMPAVPMFHINAWGLPHAATAAGAKQVFPGPSPDPADLLSLVEREGVTLTAGVPTVWLDVLEYVERTDVDADLSTLDRIVVGGAAPPERLIRGFDDRGVEVVHGWGMTETTPVGAVSHRKPELDDDEWATKRTKQGLVLPGLEFRVRDDDGEAVPWDGETLGELLVRGPWVADGYDDHDDDAFEGPWFRTGDVVTVDADGYVEVVDRAADVIKSGGEWISSQALEGVLMDHDDVREAAVVGVPHERFGERPVAFVVAETADSEALVDALGDGVSEAYPDWWVPDRFEFVEAIPKTATGKFDKVDLRSSFEGSLDGRVDATPPERAE